MRVINKTSLPNVVHRSNEFCPECPKTCQIPPSDQLRSPHRTVSVGKMFRNQYDTDATMFSPDGRLYQVEYAVEAVKQGSAVVGLRSKDFVVLACLKRQASELAAYQKKTFKIDDHIGMGISGLIADARTLAKFMRNECLNHRFVFDSEMSVSRLTKMVSDKSQVYTQKSEKRPYGVGLLIAGYDRTGPHLYETIPNGDFFEFEAQAIGARAQGAKTYLERKFEEFKDLPLDELIKHALIALKAASPKGLNVDNTTIAFVGKGREFTVLDDDATRIYVDQVKDEDEEDDEDEDEEDDEDEDGDVAMAKKASLKKGETHSV
eukprot:g65205.t1